MSRDGYVNDAGNVSITVLIKEKKYPSAITCYDITAIIDDLLDKVGDITNTTSYSDNPNVAVSVVTVVQDIYEKIRNLIFILY